MRQLSLILIGLGFIFASCGSDALPECVDDKLVSFRDEACSTTDSELGGNLVEFRFKAQTVYCFNWGICDPSKTVEIYTENCTLLCELGGPDDLTVCDNVEWVVGDTAIEQEEHYQK